MNRSFLRRALTTLVCLAGLWLWGCQLVAPLPENVCASAADCPGGWSCTLGRCTGCDSASDCPARGESPLQCDATTHQCVECRDAVDCGPGRNCEDHRCVLPPECGPALPCTDPRRPLCSTDGRCVRCTEATAVVDCGPRIACVSNQCDVPEGGCAGPPECLDRTDGRLCVDGSCGCRDNSDCPVDDPEHRACDPITRRCIECMRDEDCSTGQTCDGRRCRTLSPCEVQLRNGGDCPLDRCTVRNGQPVCLQCTTDEHCVTAGTGNRCLDNVCGCTDDAQCEDDKRCDVPSGRCVLACTGADGCAAPLPHCVGFAHKAKCSECQIDTHCANGSDGHVCVAGDCRCRTDDDCVGHPSGGTCLEGRCGCNTGDDCPFGTGCGDGDHVCGACYQTRQCAQGRVCDIDSPPGRCVDCLSDAECMDGLICDGRRFSPTRGQCIDCATDADCGFGRVCHSVQKRCADGTRATCEPDVHCGPLDDGFGATVACPDTCSDGRACRAARCQPCTPQSCMQLGLICQRSGPPESIGRCLACQTDAECGAEQQCDFSAGRCVALSVGKDCRGPDDCAGGEECRWSARGTGMCVKPGYRSVAQCAINCTGTPGGRRVACADDPDRTGQVFCSRACSINSECGAGLFCNGGACSDACVEGQRCNDGQREGFEPNQLADYTCLRPPEGGPPRCMLSPRADNAPCDTEARCLDGHLCTVDLFSSGAKRCRMACDAVGLTLCEPPPNQPTARAVCLPDSIDENGEVRSSCAASNGTVPLGGPCLGGSSDVCQAGLVCLRPPGTPLASAGHCRFPCRVAAGSADCPGQHSCVTLGTNSPIGGCVPDPTSPDWCPQVRPDARETCNLCDDNGDQQVDEGLEPVSVVLPPGTAAFGNDGTTSLVLTPYYEGTELRTLGMYLLEQPDSVDLRYVVLSQEGRVLLSGLLDTEPRTPGRPLSPGRRIAVAGPVAWGRGDRHFYIATRFFDGAGQVRLRRLRPPQPQQTAALDGVWEPGIRVGTGTQSLFNPRLMLTRGTVADPQPLLALSVQGTDQLSTVIVVPSLEVPAGGGAFLPTPVVFPASGDVLGDYTLVPRGGQFHDALLVTSTRGRIPRRVTVQRLKVVAPATGSAQGSVQAGAITDLVSQQGLIDQVAAYPTDSDTLLVATVSAANRKTNSVVQLQLLDTAFRLGGAPPPLVPVPNLKGPVALGGGLGANYILLSGVDDDATPGTNVLRPRLALVGVSMTTGKPMRTRLFAPADLFDTTRPLIELSLAFDGVRAIVGSRGGGAALGDGVSVYSGCLPLPPP